MKKILAVTCTFIFVLVALIAFTEPKEEKQSFSQPFQQQQVQPFRQKFPSKPSIANSTPGYQDYSTLVQQLEEWKRQSPGLIETGTYGTSAKGKQLTFIRITNLLDKTPKKKVLITACIHGNEPLSTSTTMAFIGVILNNYTSDKGITDLINTRDIYFVPVVSPDSYPNSRFVDGVDPNRDFPGAKDPSHHSTPSVLALQNFFKQQHFDAVISGHTYGRQFLYPPGWTRNNTPDHSFFVRLYDKMASLSHYESKRACDLYDSPIQGSEVDWYYQNGACSCVAELGTHQNIPSDEDIKVELGIIKSSYLYFIYEAPLINISTRKQLIFQEVPLVPIKSWYNLIEGRFSPSLLET